MRRETFQEIDAEAAAWAARIDAGPLSAQDEARLEQWLACDSRRRGAFMRMRAVALQSERAKALGANFDPKEFGASTNEDGLGGPQTWSRRRYAVWSAASGIAACAAAVLAVTLIPRATPYESALGQVRTVTLEDGSVITLNTDTEIRVRFDDDRRTVELDRGEALFDVAKDRARPFTVGADGTSVMAVGTSFIVKKLNSADPVEILVREGVVEVRRNVAAAKPVRMVANTRMVSSSTLAMISPTKLAPDEVTRALAWKAGRIAFEGDTLEDAAQAFTRYSDTRIIIQDPSVGREEITGLFASNDPVGFARAAALSLNLKTTVALNEVRLSRK